MTTLLPHGATLVAYLVACVVLAATPGADMALFVARTLAGGRAQGFAAQAGANAGLLVHTLAAALGLSALLAASSQAFLAVKIAGALYLLWLACVALRRGAAFDVAPSAPRGGVGGAFRTGFLVNVSNPKIVLFFVTFLPQFVDAGAPRTGARLVALGLGFIVVTTLVNALVILAAARFVAAARRNPRVLRRFDYVFATAMSAFAVRLAFAAGR